MTYLLCAQLGIEGTKASVEYIRSGRGTSDTLDASLECIRAAAQRLAAELETVHFDAERAPARRSTAPFILSMANPITGAALQHGLAKRAANVAFVAVHQPGAPLRGALIAANRRGPRRISVHRPVAREPHRLLDAHGKSLHTDSRLMRLQPYPDLLPSSPTCPASPSSPPAS